VKRVLSKAWADDCLGKATQHGGLLSLGIFAALWTAASAIRVIIDTLNRAYRVQDGGVSVHDSLKGDSQSLAHDK